MIRTNDASAAMRWMIEARRLGFDPSAHHGEVSGYLLECRSAEMGAALWSLLAATAPEECWGLIDALDVQFFVDERRAWESQCAP